MAIQHETVFRPAAADAARGLKVVWQEEYDQSTMKSTVTILSLWAWAYTAYNGSWKAIGKVTLRDANGAAAASVAVAVDRTSCNTFTAFGTTWKEITGSFTLGSIEVSHLADGDAAVEIGVETNSGQANFSYRRESDEEYRDVVPATNPQTAALENHPSGLVRVDTGGAWVMAIPYVDTGSEWVQAVPHVDNGTDWDICG